MGELQLSFDPKTIMKLFIGLILIALTLTQVSTGSRPAPAANPQWWANYLKFGEITASREVRSADADPSAMYQHYYGYPYVHGFVRTYDNYGYYPYFYRYNY